MIKFDFLPNGKRIDLLSFILYVIALWYASFHIKIEGANIVAWNEKVVVLSLLILFSVLVFLLLYSLNDKNNKLHIDFNSVNVVVILCIASYKIVGLDIHLLIKEMAATALFAFAGFVLQERRISSRLKKINHILWIGLCGGFLFIFYKSFIFCIAILIVLCGSLFSKQRIVYIAVACFSFGASAYLYIAYHIFKHGYFPHSILQGWSFDLESINKLYYLWSKNLSLFGILWAILFFFSIGNLIYRFLSYKKSSPIILGLFALCQFFFLFFSTTDREILWYGMFIPVLPYMYWMSHISFYRLNVLMVLLWECAAIAL